MTDTKHTPGPWKLVEDGQGALSIASATASPDPVTRARYLWIANVLPTRSGNPLWRQDEESPANARLIAAAPKMLEALQEICRILGPNGNPRSASAVAHKALEAINGNA